MYEPTKKNKNTWINLLMVGGIITNLFNITPLTAQEITPKIILDRRFAPDPLVVEGRSGGLLAASEVVRTEDTNTGYCDGFIHRRPNHILKLQSFFDYLKIEVESREDTTIVVEGPGGVWCNDDTYSTNPSIEGQWQPGIYKVWIGSYRENVANDYRIRLTGGNSLFQR